MIERGEWVRKVKEVNNVTQCLSARTRLRKLVIDGVLAEMGTGPKDPYRTYILKEGYYNLN